VTASQQDDLPWLVGHYFFAAIDVPSVSARKAVDIDAFRQRGA
jgi:hypothetical protein